MKKFLIFLVSIVVVVCFGLTTYYFMRNDEIIIVNTKEIFCNAGDIISLDSLKIEVKKPNKKTTYNYNAASSEVTNLISYNEVNGYYQVSSTAGGELELVISTSNKRYSEFKVKVHVGNGSLENPYYIFNQSDLSKIGSVYRLDSSYSLMNDIALTSDFQPIGYSVASGKWIGFGGYFNGNGYTISNLNLNSCECANAGLFYSVNAGASVSDLVISNANINGSYENVGVLAGTVAGNVERVVILSSTISNTNKNSNNGSLTGVFSGSSLKLSYAENVTINVSSVETPVAVVGLFNKELKQEILTGDVSEDKEDETTNEEDNSSEDLENGILDDEVIEDEIYEEEIPDTETENKPSEPVSSVTIGGFVGKLIETNVIATYCNDIVINISGVDAVVGGYAGEFVIGTNEGSIQQSYANTSCEYTDFAAFVGKVSANSTFDSSKSNMLHHFIGNIAIYKNSASDETIADNNLVKEFDNTYFKNDTYPTNSVFFNPNSSSYLIRGFISAGSVVETNEYVFYAINVTNKTMWDTDYVWKVNSTSMPSLILGSVEPSGVSGDYFRKDLNKVEVTDTTNSFENMFKTDVEDLNIQLLEDVVLTDWTPVSLKNCTIDGCGNTITLNLENANNNNVGLFSILNNCTIENLNIVIKGVSASATNGGALAAQVKSSAKTISKIKNVTVTYEGDFTAEKISNFGGLVGVVENTEISNVTVTGLNVNPNSNVMYLGGIVSLVVSGSVKDSSVNATLSARSYVGSVAAKNEGTISNVTAETIIEIVNTNSNAHSGGVVAYNEGSVLDIESNVKINVNNATTKLFVGGVAAANDGTISNVVLTGEGITLGASSKLVGTIYAGGVVATNNASISSVYNYLNSVGTYYAGADYRVGGVASINNGSIEKVLTTSNIYGNTVAGVVVEMNATGKTIDQVVVGKYDKETETLTVNQIKGDKYVAGVAVDFRAGKISNVQASSNLYGTATYSRTSLMVLVFPNGAEFTTSTINSKMFGYGTFYRDSWADFASYNNKAEFGYDSSVGNNSAIYSYFNIYKSSAYCGKLTSVVINSDYTDEGIYAQRGMAQATNFIGLIPSSDDYNGVNNVKETSNFTDSASFTGSFTFNSAYNSTYNSYRTVTKTLDFTIGSVWENNNGIRLMFLANA